jgi:large subunit ribosomal protein L22e
MGKKIIGKKGTKAVKKQSVKYTLDCKLPVEDNVIVISDFEKFLKSKIKVENKTGNLGSTVSLSKDKDKVYVSAVPPFSKRYLKYLTKKYLKKQELREYLRVVASGKNNYELRYFNIQNEEAEE